MMLLMKQQKRPRGTGSKRLRGKIWWIRYYYRGKAVDESTESRDERDADKLLRKRLGQLELGARPAARSKLTIGDVIDLTLNEYRLLKRRGLQIEELRSKAVRVAIGHFPADRFSQSAIRDYIEQRRTAGRADSTINRELSLVRHGFTLALQADPPLVERAPKIPKLAEENVREGFLEHDQYLKLRAALPDRLKCLLVVKYHLGLRLGELRNLRWEQVDIPGAAIKLPGRSTKSKKPRTAPIYGDMGPSLEMQMADRDANWPNCPWVFHYRNRQIGHHVKGWREACIAAGVPDLLRHDLRRSAVRNMERAGIPRSIATSISGHLTEAVYRRYDIVSERDLSIARERMNAFFEAKVSDSSGTKSNQEVRPS